MKVRTGTYILFAVFITAIIALSGVLYSTSRQITQATLANDDVNAIRNEMSKLRMLTFDYLLDHSERAKQQWQVESNSLEELLIPEEYNKHGHSQEGLAMLAKIRVDNQDLGKIFSQLTQAGISKELETQLSSQLLLKSQDMISLTSQLSVSSNKKIIDSQTRANYLDLVFVILLLIVALLTVYLIFITILKPLSKLYEGVEKIEQGDLNHKIGYDAKDEIGQLSRSFDEMVEAIKVSRANIEQKVAVRTQDLKNANMATQNVLMDLNTEKLNTETAKAKDDAILASIGNGVIATDSDRRIIVMNRMAEKLLGWKINEAIGKPYNEIISLEDKNGTLVPLEERPLAKVLASPTTTTTTTTTNFYIRDKNKIKFPVAITVSSIVLDNNIIGAVEVFRDITKEKAVDEAKTEFVSLASHQLRTPLTAISWYTEMILNGDVGEVVPGQKKYLDEIYQGNERMIKLVDALLNVSRLELGTFSVEPEPTNFLSIAKSVINEQKVEIDRKKLNFKETHDKLPEIPVDPKLLRIVFQNFLSNAIKYTPEKGKIDLALRKIEKDKTIGNHQIPEDSVLISVADTGYGIPKNQQDKIFTKLFRADNVKNKDTEGAGLGLYIVKSIVSQSGGLIWFDSAENKGTTFYATVPLTGMKEKAGEKKLA